MPAFLQSHECAGLYSKILSVTRSVSPTNPPFIAYNVTQLVGVGKERLRTARMRPALFFRQNVLSLANPIRQTHVFPDLVRYVRLLTNSQMVDKEPVSQVIDLSEAFAGIRFGQNQVHIDKIQTDCVYCAESHLGNKSDPRLHRMKMKPANFPILCQKILVETDCLFIFSFQKLRYGELAARVRLILIDEVLLAIWASPHRDFVIEDARLTMALASYMYPVVKGNDTGREGFRTKKVQL